MDWFSAREGSDPRTQRGASRPRLGIELVVATFAPGLVVFVLPTIALISRNPEFFRRDLSAGRDLYLAAFLTIGVGFVLWAASRRRVIRFLWVSYLLITPGWLMFELLGEWDRALGGILTVILILAASWFVVRGDRGISLRAVGLLSSLLLISFVITTSFDLQAANGGGAPVQSADRPVSATPAGETKPTPNIYHVVLDEYQTQMFELTLNDELRKKLSGFTYFPNTRTSFGRTEMSMASIIGPSDYDYESTPQAFAEIAFRGRQSSLEELRRLGYDITGFSHLSSLYGAPPPFDESVLLRDYVQFDPGEGQVSLANSLWMYAHAPAEIARGLLPEDHHAALAGGNLLPSETPVISAMSLEKFIAREGQLADSGRYTLLHLILPHFPYVMSADCGYEVGVETGPLPQAACATSLVIDLVEELKSLDRFQSSFLVVHGDHGARFESIGGKLRQLPEDLDSEEWNDARSRSLLLVKPAGVGAEGRLAVSEYPAMLTDIMPTLFDSIDAAFTSSDGRVSLLADDRPDRDKRYYHFYDKGDDGLPEGELTRYVIEGDEFRHDTTIQLPD